MDAEFGAQEEGEVEQSTPGKGRVAAGKASEAVVQDFGVGVATDGGADEGPAVADVLAVATDDVSGDVGEIWVAASQEIRAWFAEHVLRGLRDEECRRHGQCKACPALFEFPEFTPDNLGAIEGAAGRPSWDEQCDDDCDDDPWCGQADHDEDHGADRFWHVRI